MGLAHEPAGSRRSQRDRGRSYVLRFAHEPAGSRRSQRDRGRSYDRGDGSGPRYSVSWLSLLALPAWFGGVSTLLMEVNASQDPPSLGSQQRVSVALVKRRRLRQTLHGGGVLTVAVLLEGQVVLGTEAKPRVRLFRADASGRARLAKAGAVRPARERGGDCQGARITVYSINLCLDVNAMSMGRRKTQQQEIWVATPNAS